MLIAEERVAHGLLTLLGAADAKHVQRRRAAPSPCDESPLDHRPPRTIPQGNRPALRSRQDEQGDQQYECAGHGDAHMTWRVMVVLREAGGLPPCRRGIRRNGLIDGDDRRRGRPGDRGMSRGVGVRAEAMHDQHPERDHRQQQAGQHTPRGDAAASIGLRTSCRHVPHQSTDGVLPGAHHPHDQASPHLLETPSQRASTVNVADSVSSRARSALLRLDPSA